MFKPQTLKEAIVLTRMKDDQLIRQRRFFRPVPPMRAPLAPLSINRTAPLTHANPILCLAWEEMQQRRAQNLCFNCNKCFTIWNKCQGPQILVFDGYDGNNTLLSDNDLEEQTA